MPIVCWWAVLGAKGSRTWRFLMGVVKKYIHGLHLENTVRASTTTPSIHPAKRARNLLSRARAFLALRQIANALTETLKTLSTPNLHKPNILKRILLAFELLEITKIEIGRK